MYYKQSASTDPIEFKEVHDGHGFIKRRNLFGSLSKLPIGLEIWELEQGVSEGPHNHNDTEVLEEVYYFLKGTGIMTIDGEEVPVETGDAIMITPESARGIINTGAESLKLAIIWGAPTLLDGK